MLPRVILHNAVSVDGRTTGYMPDLPLFYKLAGRWEEDLTLAGSDTILAALRHKPAGAEGTAAAALPIASSGRLAIVDSRGRVKDWRRIKGWPFWSDFVSLSSEATPRSHIEYLRYQDVENITAGKERVDLREALEVLGQRFGARTVRVESGGTLNGALLREGLVDEVSLLLHPVIVGGMSPHTIFRTLELAEESPAALKLAHCEEMGDGLIWLRYEVDRQD